MTDLCLAATCHDPRGVFAQGVVDSSSTFSAAFASMVVNATTETAPATLDALRRAHPGVVVAEHPAGSIGIGTARRDAVAAGVRTGCSRIMYSDLDHVMRWATKAPVEMVEVLSRPQDADVVVVGRSAEALGMEPERLRATESVVNKVMALALGLDQQWDFMIATRILGRETASLLVEQCREESIANDVVWPLFAAGEGKTLAYVPADGLAFRARDDYSAAADERDGDVLEWVTRVTMANHHVQAMLQYLPTRGAGAAVSPSPSGRTG
ncbi:MAG: hypothetical protein H0X12_03525 [Nocardioides sp.]|nr:hypothetical protein [Nocardioides sp.]